MAVIRVAFKPSEEAVNWSEANRKRFEDQVEAFVNGTHPPMEGLLARAEHELGLVPEADATLPDRTSAINAAMIADTNVHWNQAGWESAVRKLERGTKSPN